MFLIDYDRSRGELVTLREFPDSERQQARAARLELELELYRKGIVREVVLLEAVSLEAIRRTHGRYFKTLQELANSFVSAIDSAIDLLGQVAFQTKHPLSISPKNSRTFSERNSS